MADLPGNIVGACLPHPSSYCCEIMFTKQALSGSQPKSLQLDPCSQRPLDVAYLFKHPYSKRELEPALLHTNHEPNRYNRLRIRHRRTELHCFSTCYEATRIDSTRIYSG